MMAMKALAAAVLMAASTACAADGRPAGAIEGMRVESMVRPLALQEGTPRFSWVLPAEAKGQAAYRIRVASKPESLKGAADLWDSGKVMSGETIQVPYGGKALGAGQRAYWQVAVWTEAGPVQSAVAEFGTGMLRTADWRSQWIAFPQDDGDKVPRPAPCFRREFALSKPVARATVNVAGLGQYALSINGQRVGDAQIAPNWTEYNKTVSYDSYDVTEQVKEGANAVGVMLGNGMYNVLKVPGRYTKFAGSHGAPKVILELHVEHPDGTMSVVGTDGAWKAARGPVVFTHAYGGEDYDARRELGAWDKPGYRDEGWAAAEPTAAPGSGKAELAAAINPPSKIMRTYGAGGKAAVTQPKPGVWVYDFGQNLSGWPSIAVSGPAGASVKMVPGELLANDGTVSQGSSGRPMWWTYTLKGEGVERWHPRFMYYGWRYLQVTGAEPEELPAGTDATQPAERPVAKVREIQSEFVHADLPVVGSFESSDETLNRIHRLICNAMLSNSQSVLTDCPHREKLGWIEQSHLVADGLMMNFDYANLYAKMCRDMRDAQREDGLVPAICPEYTAFKGGFLDSPEWGSAAVINPWIVYHYYGDAKTLAQQYGTMQRYVAYLGSKAKDQLVSHGLGDWYDVGPKGPGPAQLTSVGLTATAIYAHDIALLRDAAKLLGKTEDAAKYEALFKEVRSAFNAKFFNREKGEYEMGSQTGNAMPVALGLVEPEHKEAVMKRLADSITANQMRVTAGDVGFSYVVRALTEARRGDVMYAMMRQDAGPGYVYQLKKGATTLTEAWDARAGSSQNHLMLGHAEAWLYRGLAGIQQEPGSVAFQKIVIQPEILEALPEVDGRAFVKATYASARGLIESGWERRGKRVTLTVMIPPTSTATVYVPAREASAVKAPAGAVKDSDGKDEVLYRVGSGRWVFESTLP